MVNTWVEQAWEQVVHKIDKTSHTVGAAFQWYREWPLRNDSGP